MKMHSEPEATFEETFPKHSFSVLIRMGIVLATQLAAIRRRALLVPAARRRGPTENSGHHPHLAT